MDKKEGYLCAAKSADSGCKDECILFGKNTGEGTKSFCGFMMNDLTPFKTKPQARKALEELIEWDFIVSVQLASVKMCIAKTQEELPKLKDSKSLVAIMYDDYVGSIYTIFGPITIEGAPTAYPLCGTRIERNNFQGWKEYDRAYYAAQEINRQAQCRAYLADWHLELIGDIVKGPAYK